MKDLLWDEFQESVQEGLIRDRSILDVLSKYQDSTARVNRSIVKAVTGCGCIRVNAAKPEVPAEISLRELRAYMDDHVEGELCAHCREVVEEEVGRQLFYMAALANILNLNVYDILIKEHKKVSTLGIYNIC
ncbi:MAG: DUF1573 domain-containing protein [Clostridia bacterium]|nr:DUF1573 domain-containing protein [Clostridia bacterium]